MKWIKMIFFTIFGAGFVAGVAFCSIVVTDPVTDKLKSSQPTINEIDLQYYQHQRALQAQEEEAKTKENIAYYKRQHEQALRLQKWAGIAAIALASVTGYALLTLVFIFFWNRFHKMVEAKEEALYQAAPISPQRQPGYGEFTPLTLRPQPAPVHRHNNGHVPQVRIQG